MKNPNQKSDFFRLTDITKKACIRFLYNAKGKSEGAAEVDFCFQRKGTVLGVDVKPGGARRLRSLFSFAEEVQSHRLVRIYSGHLRKERVKIGGRIYNLTSIPFYLTPRILNVHCGYDPLINWC